MTPFHARLLFFSAAIFNWLAVALLAPWFGLAEPFGLIAAGSSIYDHIALAVIFTFGCCYWMIALDLAGNRPLVLLGALLKLAVVAIIYGHALRGDAPWNMAALVTVDLVYALFFLSYLKTSAIARQQTSTANSGV